MEKIQKLNEIIKNNTNDNDKIERLILDLFKEQIKENSYYDNLILTEEQYSLLDDSFDFSVFGETLVSVEYEGEVDFVHCFLLKI